MKFLNFFLLLWVIFALLDPDPDTESGFETLPINPYLFSNLAGCLSVEDFGGAAALHQTWTSLGSLCLQSQEAKVSLSIM
jgi:hypothetical protein